MFAIFLVIFISYLVVSASLLAIALKLKKANKFIFEYWSKSSGRIPVTIKNSMNIDIKKIAKLQDKEIDALAALLPVEAMPNANHYKLRRVKQVRSKIHDTRMLSSISASFVLLNTPYFIGMLCLLTYHIITHDPNLDVELDLTGRNIMFRIRLQICIIVGEILQLINFSVIGLLLYFSGQIYRIHSVRLIKHIFSRLS